MKKITKIVFSCLLLVVLTFSMFGCKEIENGSKIQRMNVELEFLNASGEVVDTQTAQIKLYLNFAPKTCEHFMMLAEEGYYDGVTISNVNDTWCEFGAYTRTGNTLTAKEYDYGTIEGEFLKNGVGGTKLTPSSGALIMKRDYDVNDGSNNSKKYDSATSSVIVTFSATAKFGISEYCMFGKLVDDDGEEYDETVDDADLDRNVLSSLGKFNTIERTATDADGNKLYYFEKDCLSNISKYDSIKSDYYSIVTDAEGELHYYIGAEAIAENELLDDNLDDFKQLLNDKSDYFLIVSYTQVRIKTITKA